MDSLVEVEEVVELDSSDDPVVVVGDVSGTLVVDVTVPGAAVVWSPLVGVAVCPSVWDGGVEASPPPLPVGVDAGGLSSLGSVVLPPSLPPARLGQRILPALMTTTKKRGSCQC